MGVGFSRGLRKISSRVQDTTCDSDWKHFAASLTNLSASLQRVELTLHVHSVISNSGIQAFRIAIKYPTYCNSPHNQLNIAMFVNETPVELMYPELHPMQIDLHLCQGAHQVMLTSPKHDNLRPHLIVRTNSATRQTLWTGPDILYYLIRHKALQQLLLSQCASS
jgi:hypothetical protein